MGGNVFSCYNPGTMMNLPTKIASVLAVFAAAAVLASCASVSVTKMNHAVLLSVPLTKPAIIYIAPFDTSSGDFRVDRDGELLAEFKQNLQQMLSVALVTDIPNHLVPAQGVTSYPDQGNAWLVTGKFVRVNQGSRMLRTVVGFGAGGTKIETAVAVYNLAGRSNVPFLTFETTGGSGAEPGMVVSMDPISAALSAVSGVAKGLSDDTKRTARMITATLSEYMYNEGWITADQKLTPKMKTED